MNIVALLLTCLTSALDTNGWTIIPPAPADARVRYVSSSGSDANDGKTPETAFQTIALGMTQMRLNNSDRLLLKRGDTFYAGTGATAGYVQINAYGRSADEPFVISTYGEGPRPIIREGSFFCYSDEWFSNHAANHIRIIGLNFSGNYTANPVTKNTKAIKVYGFGTDFVIEDCRFNDYEGAFRFGDGAMARGGVNNLAIRRCVVTDCFGLAFYANTMDGTTIEECLFDRNGYAGDFTSDNKFAHNVYCKEMTHFTARRNIISRGNNFGIKLSADKPSSFTDFVVEDNVFYDNGIGLDHSSGPTGDIQTTFTHQRGMIRRNAFTERQRTRSMVGYFLNSDAVTFDGNVYQHNWTTPLNANVANVWNGHHRNVTLTNNIIHDWPNGGFNTLTQKAAEYTENLVETGRLENSPAGTFSDPGRTLGAFSASIGGTDNALEFLASVAAMDRSNWDSRVYGAVDYIFAGYVAPTPDPDPIPDPEPIPDPTPDPDPVPDPVPSKLETALIAAAKAFLAIMEPQ